MENDELDDQVQDLVQQLNDNNKNLKKSQKTEEFELNKDDLEQFLLNKACLLYTSPSPRDRG